MPQTDSHASTPPGAGARVGYVRVSTIAQTLEQQNAALAAAGVTKTFSDTMSGARDDRPGLAALLDYVRDRDTVVVQGPERFSVYRIDRRFTHLVAFSKPVPQDTYRRYAAVPARHKPSVASTRDCECDHSRA